MRFFFLMIRPTPRTTRTDTLFPYTTLFRTSRFLPALRTGVDYPTILLQGFYGLDRAFLAACRANPDRDYGFPASRLALQPAHKTPRGRGWAQRTCACSSPQSLGERATYGTLVRFNGTEVTPNSQGK